MPCPDFEAPACAPEMTAAETAVTYIIHRVVNDRDFSHCMLLTKSLWLCVEAEAARRGVTHEAVERSIKAAMAAAQPRLERSSAGVARVVRLQEQLDRVGAEVADLRHNGKINAEAYRRLSELVDASRDQTLAQSIAEEKGDTYRGLLADLLHLFDQADELDPPGGLTVLQIPCVEADHVLKQARDAMRKS